METEPGYCRATDYTENGKAPATGVLVAGEVLITSDCYRG
jgi:hypothetical protein